MWAISIIDETSNEFRARVESPNNFQQNSYRRIVILEREGIYAIIGRKKGEKNTTLQAYRFSKDTKYSWTKSKIVQWLNKNHIKVGK